MASWTEIPNSSLETGAPARSVDALAFRDNPIAIAEGATGAPRISNLAFNDLTIGAEKLQAGTDERDWIIARVSPAVYAVGSYIFAERELASASYNPGDTVAGSDIRPVGVVTYTNVENYYLGQSISFGTGISGTWRCMGYSSNNQIVLGDRHTTSTLWLRIA